MTDKEWMQLELNRMVKAEGGKVSVERMTEIVSDLSRRLRENPNLPREVNTLTADELIARARQKTATASSSGFCASSRTTSPPPAWRSSTSPRTPTTACITMRI